MVGWILFAITYVFVAFVFAVQLNRVYPRYKNIGFAWIVMLVLWWWVSLEFIGSPDTLDKSI